MFFKSLIAGGVMLCGPSLALAQDGKITEVRVATEGSYAPWNFTGPGGNLDGFEIELAADLCHRMTVKCNTVAQDWDGLIPALNAGKFDAIISAMSVTEERQKVVDFTKVYAAGPNGWGVLEDSPLTALAGEGRLINLDKDPEAAKKMYEEWKPLLKGKVVGVQGSTVYSAFLEQHFKDTVEIREYKTTEQHDLDLAAGRIDAVFAALPVLQATREKPEFADLVIAGSTLQGAELGRGVAVALRKGDNGLKDLFNKAIAEAVNDGTVKRLSQKWFKVDMTPMN